MNKGIISNRRLIQALIGGTLIVLVVYFKVNLLIILLLGVFAGILFGKVFCRWMCPMGFFMEMILTQDNSNYTTTISLAAQ
ncbi:MAG: 4Fe-4S binding protein [Clostridia bacterium]